MIIPILPEGAPKLRIVPQGDFSASAAFSKGNYTGEGWSSLIGIVTAIVGNILISLALNTQRYAHIRLEREWEEKEKRWRLGKRKSLAEERYAGRHDATTEGRVQAKVRGGDQGHRNQLAYPARERYDEQEAGESEPLLPSDRGRNSLESNHSGSAKERRTTEAHRKSYLRSPYWWIGIILMTIGEAGNFLAYGFAPASIVSPLGVVALISNCIIAPFMLKEPFRIRDLFGVIVAVAGAVTVVLSARNNNPKLGPEEIWRLITTWEFETYLGVTCVLIVGLMAASRKYGEKSTFIDLGLVGLFGGYTALSTKGVASLLSYTLWRALTFPVTYLLVAVLAGTAVMQIKYVNRALQRFDATQVIPTQFVLFTLSVILGSAVLYRDFEKTPSDKAGKFVGGCAMTFLGVWLITSARPSGHHEEEERAPEDEAAISLVAGDGYGDDIEAEAARHTRRRSSKSLPVVPEIPSIAVTAQPSAAVTHPAPPLEVPSPVTENPWQPITERLYGHLEPSTPTAPSVPPALKPTISAPVLPSEAQSLSHRPRTPRNTSELLASPVTPQTNRPLNIACNSIAGLIPGPLTSPLSAPLSAVVADSIRRGVDVPARRRSVARARIPESSPTGGTRSRGASDADVPESVHSSLPRDAAFQPSSGIGR